MSLLLKPVDLRATLSFEPSQGNGNVLIRVSCRDVADKRQRVYKGAVCALTEVRAHGVRSIANQYDIAARPGVAAHAAVLQAHHAIPAAVLR